MAKGDIISRLKLESGEFDSKIKRAGQELLAYSEHCKKMGLQMGYANRDAKEFAKQLGSMATVSTTARGKINELSDAFVNAKVMYKNMTDEEKKGEFGRNLAASLDQLKTRLNDAKKDLADVTNELNGSKFGQFGNVIDTIGSKLGVTGNLTEMLTSKTALLTGAVGAGIAVVTKSTEAWANYNAELAKQDQVTQVTTGLKGDDADRMTDKMRALSDTYNVDFREAVNAANTLMTQFGKTGDEATQLIKDGMQGMIQGDGPKLLSMIQQYAPAFRDAGVSASQLVAVIQNSEGGIFTDQNMNAIVMGIKNIRLMTKATSDALAQLGIDGEKMSKQLSDGSLTIFDALKQVANQIQTVDSNSKEAGEVMQQVFGRQGAMAGTKLGEAIATLNTNLEETKKQTGELGDALADLQTANEKLNKAIRDCFEYDGWDQMAAGIRSNLITALAGVLEKLAAIKTELRDLFSGNSLTDWLKGKLNAGQNGNNPKLGLGGMNWHAQNTGPQGSYTVVTDSKTEKVISAQHQDLTTPQPTRTVNPRRTTGGNKNTIKEEKDEFTEIIGLIGNAQERVSDLQKQMRETWDGNKIASLRKDLKASQDELDVLQGKLPKDSKVELTITADDTDALQKVKDIEGVTLDEKTMTVTANTQEALQKVKDIEGVTLDEKTMTVTANTQEALQKVQELVSDIDGKVVNVKVVPVITDEDIDEQLQRQYGKAIQVPITPKLTAGEELVQSIRIKLAEDNINADMQTLRTLLETQIKNGIEGIDIPTDMLMQAIIGEGLNIPDEYWKNLQDQFNDKLKEMGLDQLDIDFKTGESKKKDKKEKSPLEGSKQLVSGLNQVAGGLQMMGVKLPEEVQQVLGVIQGLMTVIEGVNTVIGVTQTASLTANTTAMVALTAALWANTATSFFSFANGGIVPSFANGGLIGQAANGLMIPGHSFSGDNLRMPVDGGRGMIGVNSGELILNKAAQGNLASQLSDGPMTDIAWSVAINAEQIMLVANNRGKRTGKGEILQGRNKRV